MFIDMNWSLFHTEIALVSLALATLLLDLFLPRNNERAQILANTGLFGLALILMMLCFQPVRPGICLNGAFVLDPLAAFFKILFLLAGLFVLFMAREYQSRLKRGHGEWILLILLALTGMIFLASANEFLFLFISLEILSVSLYVMTAYLKDEAASIEAGIKYLVMGALSTAIFLFGLSFIYGTTGSTSFLQIQQTLSSLPSLPAPFIFGMILVVASLGFKIAAVPFHLWAPDVYQGAPAPVTAFLAIGSKAAGFAALIRLMMTVFAPAQAQLTFLFSILAALTILYGNLGAIPQTNLKRLLGYSSIGHAGYLLLGLAAFSNSGQEALLYYLVSYLFSTAGAFLVIVAISRHTQSDDIRELAGLSQRSPVLAAGMLLSLLSLAGIPPLAGFFAKFYLLWATVKSGLLWLALVAVLNVITSLYYYLKVVKVMYVDKPQDPQPILPPIGQKAFQYLSIFGILFLGIFQGPLVRIVTSVFSN